MGRLSKGPVDLAKLEPALSRHPSGRISNHARVFAPVIPNRIREQQILKIYETNTTNQSQPARRFSFNRSHLSADCGRKDHRRSTDLEADRFSQTKQRLSRDRSVPRLRRGIFSVHCDRLDLGLADLSEHHGNGADGARLLKAAAGTA